VSLKGISCSLVVEVEDYSHWSCPVETGRNIVTSSDGWGNLFPLAQVKGEHQRVFELDIHRCRGTQFTHPRLLYVMIKSGTGDSSESTCQYIDVQTPMSDVALHAGGVTVQDQDDEVGRLNHCSDPTPRGILSAHATQRSTSLDQCICRNQPHHC